MSDPRTTALGVRLLFYRIYELDRPAVLPHLHGFAVFSHVSLAFLSTFFHLFGMPAPDASLPASFFRGDYSTPQQVHAEGSGRCLDEYLDTVEGAVQRVFDFAHTSAQHLVDTVGHDRDVEYYLRMIFHRGAYLHPFPPAVPHFLSVADVSGESGHFSYVVNMY